MVCLWLKQKGMALTIYYEILRCYLCDTNFSHLLMLEYELEFWSSRCGVIVLFCCFWRGILVYKVVDLDFVLCNIYWHFFFPSLKHSAVFLFGKKHCWCRFGFLSIPCEAQVLLCSVVADHLLSSFEGRISICCPPFTSEDRWLAICNQLKGWSREWASWYWNDKLRMRLFYRKSTI